MIAMYVIVLRDKAVRTLTQKNEKKQQTFAFDEKGDRVNVGQVRHPCPIIIEGDISEMIHRLTLYLFGTWQHLLRSQKASATV